MKFVTFNIRCDFGQDGANNFIYRRPLILEKIRQEKPDIIGFQEVLPHVAAWLKENLTEYYIAGCGREKDLTGEAMIIAYRKERFQSVSLETFWLSPTPYVPGSRYPVQSMCPRTATDVVFEDMETGKVFRVINTHLDHECAGARKLGLEQILAHLRAEKAFADVPVILSGDFNAEPDSEEMKPLRETAGLVNATEGIGITFHNYHRDDPNDPQCSIDYIILKGTGNAGRWKNGRSRRTVCAFLIIIRSVRNLFKIWMQEAAAGRKNLLAAFFYDSYRKNL